MFTGLELTRTRAAVAALVATAAIGGFAIAWANASSPSASPPGELASSDEAPGDISGPCDEAENAGKPECAGVVPVDATKPDDTIGGVTTTTTTAGAAPVTAAPSDVRSFAAADAGTVTYAVDGATLTLIDAAPAAGWRVEVEQADGAELDLDFRSGTRRVQVDVELEDGGVRERVRVRDDADDTRTEITNGIVTRVEDDRDDHDDSDDLMVDDSDDRDDADRVDDDGHDRDGSDARVDDSEDDSGHGSDDDRADDDSGHGSDDADDDSGHGGDDDRGSDG